MTTLEEIYEKAGVILRNICEELEDASIGMRVEGCHIFYHIQIGDRRIFKALSFYELIYIRDLNYLSDNISYLVRSELEKSQKNKVDFESRMV